MGAMLSWVRMAGKLFYDLNKYVERLESEFKNVGSEYGGAEFSGYISRECGCIKGGRGWWP